MNASGPAAPVGHKAFPTPCQGDFLYPRIPASPCSGVEGPSQWETNQETRTHKTCSFSPRNNIFIVKSLVLWFILKTDSPTLLSSCVITLNHPWLRGTKNAATGSENTSSSTSTLHNLPEEVITITSVKNAFNFYITNVQHVYHRPFKDHLSLTQKENTVRYCCPFFYFFSTKGACMFEYVYIYISQTSLKK